MYAASQSGPSAAYTGPGRTYVPTSDALIVPRWGQGPRADAGWYNETRRDSRPNPGRRVATRRSATGTKPDPDVRCADTNTLRYHPDAPYADAREQRHWHPQTSVDCTGYVAGNRTGED